jgi:nucleoside-diphosphate-sugar epimerase
MKTRNFDYVGSNVEAVGNIAKVCKEVGVPKFIHVSAVAANEESPSEWLRCKAMGEAQVRPLKPSSPAREARRRVCSHPTPRSAPHPKARTLAPQNAPPSLCTVLLDTAGMGHGAQDVVRAAC